MSKERIAPKLTANDVNGESGYPYNCVGEEEYVAQLSASHAKIECTSTLGGVMSAKFKQAIECIGELSSREKALVAHCLISSLETKQDEGVDDAWAKLAEKRYQDLDSGLVKGLSWQEIKDSIKA